MKTAILTWFHYHNYGTALQVMALNKKVQQISGKSFVIDYKPHGKLVRFPDKINILKKGYGYLLRKIKGSKYLDANKIYSCVDREQKFLNFYDEYLKFSDECSNMSDLENLNGQYDAFICGSDQIWSPSYFNSHYFLDFVKDEEKMIAYAPSIGMEKIHDKYVYERIFELIGRFRHISTREKKSSEFLGGIINKKVDTVLDPTLLLNAKEWSEVLGISETWGDKPYLLVYFLGNNKSYWKSVYKLAQIKGLEVKIIPVFHGDFKRNGCISETVGPKDFVNLIKNAEFVCTDSFHGTVFSINFGKDFCVFERFKKSDAKNQNLRIYNILNLFGLEGRLYSKKTLLKRVLKTIEYKKINHKLEEEREKSFKFLQNSLQSVQNSKKTNEDKNHIINSSSLCCGCNSCANVCPVSAIKVKMNGDGFYSVFMDDNKCISCGKCRDVCPFMGKINDYEIIKGGLYSFKDNDEDILKKSSSGGFSYRLSKILLDKGWSVIGCAFDKEQQIAKHIMVTKNNITDLKLLQGSKYIQSDFSQVVPQIKQCNSPAVIFGTPCQIAGMKKLFKNRDDILYVDLICHGTPTYLLFKKYMTEMKNKYQLSENTSVLFRYKQKDWHNKHIYISDCYKDFCISQDKDYFYKMFERGHCYSPSCYECRWRNKCEADIRIGDYWGERFARDNTGVSMILSMTEKGDTIVDMLYKADCAKIERQSIEDYFNCQQVKNIPRPVFYEEMIKELKDKEISLEKVIKKYVTPFENEKSGMEKMVRRIMKYVQK